MIPFLREGQGSYGAARSYPRTVIASTHYDAESKEPDFSRHNANVLKIGLNFAMSIARRKRIKIAPEFCLALLGD